MGRYFSGILFTMFYPFIMTILVYFFLRIETSFVMFLQFLIIAVLINLVGCSLGFFIGVVCDNIHTGKMVVMFL